MASIEERLDAVFDRPQPPTFWAVVEVVATAPLTSRVQRITLAGAELDPFLRGYQPGDAVKLLLADPPTPRAEQRGTPGVHGRAYTLINPDLAAGRADIDVILHAEGPGSAWARAALPGWRVLIGGPRLGFTPPPGASAFRLFADLSALPAAIEIARAARLAGRPVSLSVEVPDGDEVRDLASLDADVTWLLAGAEPCAALLEHVRSLDWVGGADGPVVWAAGESAVIRRIRRLLRVEHGLARHRVTVGGYWTRGGVGIDTGRVAAAAALARAGGFDGNQYDLDSFEPDVDGAGPPP